MVMKRNAMRKNLYQSILKSFGRYVAIVAIIALGASLFLGLLMTKTDMVATGQKFADQQNMFDLRLVSTYGWSAEQVQEAAQLEGIVDAEGIFYQDYIARLGDAKDDSVYRFYAIPERINQIYLRGGRLPQNNTECVADGFSLNDSILGTKIYISDNNDEDVLETLKYREYTIVGYVSSPLYMDMNRGTTSVGNGVLSNILYLPQDVFDVDYCTEIHLTIPGTHKIYSRAYNDILEDAADTISSQADAMGEVRFREVKVEAEKSYQEGMEEYLDGVKEYEEGKAEAEQELADAEKELKDAEQEIEDTYVKLQNAERDLYNAGLELNDKEAALNQGKVTLSEQKTQVFADLDDAKTKLTAGKNALEEAFPGMSLQNIYTHLMSVCSSIDSLQQQIVDLDSEDPEYETKKTAYEADIAKLRSENAMMLSIKDRIVELYLGIEALSGQRKAAEDEFARKEKEITDGVKQIAEARVTIKNSITEVYNGYEELKDARVEVADGWEEYYEAKAEAEAELADAEAELADAKIELADAREEIDAMKPAEVFVLDRNSNVGYNSLDSSSDIVAGVSRVFPVFFLLVAALVCITTMSRMIDEERTQIGTLKALGYTNREIISKYMFYAGSGTIIGCTLGILLGSSIFPQTLWRAYCIMLYITPDVVLTADWPLNILVVAAYTVVMLAVTWYCCHKTLEEEPAELIRPKAPTQGKQMLFEKFSFWNKISFLNKVTIRNIFRYRQRLAMMLVGIGGCTALLVTGFGLRDSIVNVVDFQFQDITFYDMEVYFTEEQDMEQQRDFLSEVTAQDNKAMFYHQSSMEVEFGNTVKEIYMISADEELNNYIDFHSGDKNLPMPGMNEVLLSVGVSEMMGINPGDQIIMRNSDMEVLNLTVSELYDNHVYNYAIILPETIEAQWGELPEQQMAFVQVADGQDVHALSAEIADMDSVMNVSVSEDLANMVSRMMEALDLVIVVVVVCSGLLAVIVLYNLTNININERIREIATIKVLGFNASETAAYVFKENIALTVIGSVLGLFFGKLLLAFVMTQVKIDMVWFRNMIMPLSYVWAIVLTLASAFVVNFIFYFKLDKINMAEALKSVE